MITGFEIETADLTPEEKKWAHIIKTTIERFHIGEEKAVTSERIIAGMRTHHKVKISGARVRKIINYLRITRKIKNLVATSKGYYIETDKRKILKYVKSLRERAEAINFVADQILKDLN